MNFELLTPFDAGIEPELVVAQIVAAVSLLAWVVLWRLRGGWWRADQRLPSGGPSRAAVLDAWPCIVAVVPARDEFPVIARSIGALLDLDYPLPVSVVLVDDGSSDGTAQAARACAEARGPAAAARLHVHTGAPRPAGWSGKVWAMHQGVAAARERVPAATHILFTDADIAHAPDNLRTLAARAVGADQVGRPHVLVSQMVMLRTERFWERLLIPAFVYFFQKLYPFARVNTPGRPEAAAAGGVMLVDIAALDRAGGITAIAGRLIDDCALAAILKPQGPIFLGLTTAAESLRGYGGLPGVWHMVARTAYTQLDHSPLKLLGTVLGMLLLYVVPPAAAMIGWLRAELLIELLGALAWALIWRTAVPTLALYRRNAALGLAVPVAGVLYTAMTVASAIAHWRGRGGAWKGRLAGARDEHPA